MDTCWQRGKGCLALALTSMDMHARRDSQSLVFPGYEHKMSTSFLFLLSIFAGDKFRASADACKRDFLAGLSKAVKHQNGFPPPTAKC